MVDYLLRRGRYDPARTGRYPRRGVRQNGGIHWPAIIAHALGMVASLFWNKRGVRRAVLRRADLQPLPWPAGRDFSWLIGIVVGGGVYYLLAWPGVKRELAGMVSPQSVSQRRD